MSGNVFSLCICWSSFLWKCTLRNVDTEGTPSILPFFLLRFFWCRLSHSPWPLIFRTKTTHWIIPLCLPLPWARQGSVGWSTGAARSIGSTANAQVFFQAFEWCLWPPETEISLSYFWSFSSKSGVGVSGSLVQGHTPGCDLICVHMSFEKAGQLPFYPFNHCLRM